MEIKIDPRAVFPPDMTQEELDEMVAMMQKLADEGRLEEVSREITEEEYMMLVAIGAISEEEIKPN